MFKTGPIFKHLTESKYRTTVLQGGSSAGKTYSTLQALLIWAVTRPRLVITVVAQDIPNVKKGALRDMQHILSDAPEFNPYIADYNKADRIYQFTNGSIIEFVSFQDEQDARGGRRDILFINECNAISYMVYWQLSLRTKEKEILDYNPHTTFWVHDKVLGKEGVELVISDHRHNPFLTDQQHAAIEGIEDKDLHKVYARGMTGILKGTIYKNWVQIPEEDFVWSDGIVWYVDYEGKSEKKGADPTAAGKIAFRPKDCEFDFVAKELIHTKNVTSDIIAKVFWDNGYKSGQPAYCDHNNVARTNELRLLGINAMPAIKGPVLSGILFVRRFKVAYIGKNIHEEVGKYKFMEIEGILTNMPADEWNHQMDGIRYGIYSHSLLTGNIS